MHNRCLSFFDIHVSCFYFIHYAQFVHYFENLDSTPPPFKLKLSITEGAKSSVGELSGVYTLQPSTLDGFPHWKQVIGLHSIWFDKDHCSWVVGLTSDMSSSDLKIVGPRFVMEWPHMLQKRWIYNSYPYLNTIIKEEEAVWLNGGTNVIVDDYGEGKPFSTSIYRKVLLMLVLTL